LASRITSHRERIEACIAGEELDRPPVAMWRHFPVDDQSPDSLAAATIEFQKAFDFDLVKVSPSSSFCLKDWGAKDEWQGASEGTREYTQRVIQDPDDWQRLPVLDPGQGFLAAQIECLRTIVGELGEEVHVIQTVFSPLAQAKNLAGAENLLVHARKYPQALQAGLATIAESIKRFIVSVQQIGADGVFYAVQHAQYSLFTHQEYDQFGKAFDLLALEPAKDMSVNMLHLHGTQIMFDRFLEYPVAIINWHDRETEPSLAQAKRQFNGALCGGIQRIETMVLGTPGKVAEEARIAIRETGGQRLVLGTGCVMPVVTPRANILAARQSVEVT
jgi:uroporphyrinogen decarboxylase